MLRGLGSVVVVGVSDLLDGNQLSVARTAVAHTGGVNFRRLTPAEGRARRRSVVHVPL